VRVVTVLLVVPFIAATACGGSQIPSGSTTSTPAVDVVDVRASDGTVRLAAGQQLRVDMGRVNESVGDAWYLTTRPDPTVLIEKEHQLDPVSCTGCTQSLKWSFTAVAAGSTTLGFRYCYRSRPESCQADNGPKDPVSLSVTVS
jgi:hypothetical protein